MCLFTFRFFIWNSLLVAIGIISTIRMVLGFGFDLSKIATTVTTAITDNSIIRNTKEKINEKEEDKQKKWQKCSRLNEYLQGRRKVFQELVDNLYMKYMNELT